MCVNVSRCCRSVRKILVNGCKSWQILVNVSNVSVKCMYFLTCGSRPGTLLYLWNQTENDQQIQKLHQENNRKRQKNDEIDSFSEVRAYSAGQASSLFGRYSSLFGRSDWLNRLFVSRIGPASLFGRCIRTHLASIPTASQNQEYQEFSRNSQKKRAYSAGVAE